MVNRLFVSCAFSRPERTYDRMAMAIKALDAACVEIHFALWHLRTVQSAGEIRDRLKAVLDVNDQLLVVDASNTRAAWLNLGKGASDSLRDLAP